MVLLMLPHALHQADGTSSLDEPRPRPAFNGGAVESEQTRARAELIQRVGVCRSRRHLLFCEAYRLLRRREEPCSQTMVGGRPLNAVTGCIALKRLERGDTLRKQDLHPGHRCDGAYRRRIRGIGATRFGEYRGALRKVQLVGFAIALPGERSRAG